MEAWAAGSSDPGAQDRAFLMENATGDGRSYLVRNLVCGGAYYGCFELVDVNAPFQPADFALVDYFGNLLSLVMPHQGRPQPTEEPLGRCATCWTGGRLVSCRFCLKCKIKNEQNNHANRWYVAGARCAYRTLYSVSYTHLEVYKRQIFILRILVCRLCIKLK